MDDENTLCKIDLFSDDFCNEKRISKTYLALKKTFIPLLMGSLELKPLLSVSTVSVDGPVTVNDVDHHVRVTSHVIVPSDEKDEDVNDADEDEDEEELDDNQTRRCRRTIRCRDICDNDEDDEEEEDDDDEEECEGEDDECDDDENENNNDDGDEEDEDIGDDCNDEDDQEERESIKEDEEDDHLIKTQFCNERVESDMDSYCLIRSPHQCRDVNYFQQNMEQGNEGYDCQDDTDKSNNKTEEAPNACPNNEDSEIDELHQGCVNISKEELLEICRKYSNYDQKFGKKRKKSESRVSSKSENNKDKNPSLKRIANNYICKENANENKDPKKNVKTTKENLECPQDHDIVNDCDDNVENGSDDNPDCDGRKNVSEDDCHENDSDDNSDKNKYDDNDNDDHNDNDDNDDDNCSDEDDDGDDDDYYSCEKRYSVQNPTIDEKSKKENSSKPQRASPNYSCYGKKTALEKHQTIFCKTSTKHSFAIKETDTYTSIDHSCGDKNIRVKNKKIKKSRNSTNADIFPDVVALYYDDILTNEAKIMKIGLKFEDKRKNCQEGRRTTKETRYFDKNSIGNNRNLGKEKICNKEYANDCNNSNLIDVDEDKGDYYQPNEEGKNGDSTEKCSFEDLKGSGDYMAYIIGKRASERGLAFSVDDVGEKMPQAEHCELQNVSFRGHIEGETVGTEQSASEYGGCCILEHKPNYATKPIGDSNQADDGYFYSDPHLSSNLYHAYSSPGSVSDGLNLADIFEKHFEPNYFTFQQDELFQINLASNLTSKQEMSPLAGINLEQCKRMFESLKQRALKEDDEDYFELRNPDELKKKGKMFRLPKTVSGMSLDSDNNIRKNNEKVGSLIKNLVAILTNSRTRLIQKTPKTNLKIDEKDASENLSEKAKFSEKKCFTFGRYKAKSSEKALSINEPISTKKNKKKTESKFSYIVEKANKLPEDRKELEIKTKSLTKIVSGSRKSISRDRVESLEKSVVGTIRTVENSKMNLVELKEVGSKSAVKSILDFCIDKVKRTLQNSTSNESSKYENKKVESTVSNESFRLAEDIAKSADNKSNEDTKCSVSSVEQDTNDIATNEEQKVDIVYDHVESCITTIDNCSNRVAEVIPKNTLSNSPEKKVVATLENCISSTSKTRLESIADVPLCLDKVVKESVVQTESSPEGNQGDNLSKFGDMSDDDNNSIFSDIDIILDKVSKIFEETQSRVNQSRLRSGAAFGFGDHLENKKKNVCYTKPILKRKLIEEGENKQENIAEIFNRNLCHEKGDTPAIDGNISELESSGINADGSAIRAQSLEERNKANVISTVSKLCEKLERFSMVPAASSDSCKSNYRTNAVKRELNDAALMSQDSIVNNNAQQLDSTNNMVTEVLTLIKDNDNTQAMQTAYEITDKTRTNQTVYAITNNMLTNKVNPFYKVTEKNKSKELKATTENRVLPKIKGTLQCVKIHKERTDEVLTQKNFARFVRKQFFNTRKNSNSILTKNFAVSSPANLPRSANSLDVIRSITSKNGSIGGGKFADSISSLKDVTSRHQAIGNFTTPDKKIYCVQNIIKDSAKTQFRNKDLPAQICPNYQKNALEFKNTKEPQTACTNNHIKSRDLHGLVLFPTLATSPVQFTATKKKIKRERSVSEKPSTTNISSSKHRGWKNNQFSGEFVSDAIKNVKSQDKFKITQIISSHYTNPSYADVSKSDKMNKFKCSVRVRVPEEVKALPLRFENNKAHEMSAVAYGNSNMNANCGYEEDDPCPSYLQHDAFADVTDDREPSQNISNMCHISPICEIEANFSNEEAVNIIMESFKLDRVLNPEPVCSLVSFDQHLPSKARAVCRIDDIQNRIAPQTDHILSNDHASLSTNDCVIMERIGNVHKPIIHGDLLLDPKFDKAAQKDINKTWCKLGNVDDSDINVTRNYIHKIPSPSYKQKVGDSSAMLHKDGENNLKNGCDNEIQNTEQIRGGLSENRASATKKENNRTKFSWKYSPQIDSRSGSGDTDDNINIRRYAKYNNEQFQGVPDSTGKYNIKDDIQSFFGGPYQLPIGYSPLSVDGAGNSYSVKINNSALTSEVYTTGKIKAVDINTVGSADVDYMDDTLVYNQGNSGGMWTKFGFVQVEEDGRKEHSESDDLYSAGVVIGNPWKTRGNYEKKKPEITEESECRTSTIYSTVMKICDERKAPAKDQFWNKSYSLPLSKDERILKMSSALLDKKFEDAADVGIKDDRVNSAITESRNVVPVISINPENIEDKIKKSVIVNKVLSPSISETTGQIENVPSYTNMKPAMQRKASSPMTREASSQTRNNSSPTRDEAVKEKQKPFYKARSSSSGDATFHLRGSFLKEEAVDDLGYISRLVSGKDENVKSVNEELKISEVHTNGNAWRKGSDRVPTLIRRKLSAIVGEVQSKTVNLSILESKSKLETSNVILKDRIGSPKTKKKKSSDKNLDFGRLNKVDKMPSPQMNSGSDKQSSVAMATDGNKIMHRYTDQAKTDKHSNKKKKNLSEEYKKSITDFTNVSAKERKEPLSFKVTHNLEPSGRPGFDLFPTFAPSQESLINAERNAKKHTSSKKEVKTTRRSKAKGSKQHEFGERINFDMSSQSGSKITANNNHNNLKDIENNISRYKPSAEIETRESPRGNYRYGIGSDERNIIVVNKPTKPNNQGMEQSHVKDCSGLNNRTGSMSFIELASPKRSVQYKEEFVRNASVGKIKSTLSADLPRTRINKCLGNGLDEYTKHWSRDGHVEHGNSRGERRLQKAIGQRSQSFESNRGKEIGAGYANKLYSGIDATYETNCTKYNYIFARSSNTVENIATKPPRTNTDKNDKSVRSDRDWVNKDSKMFSTTEVRNTRSLSASPDRRKMEQFVSESEKQFKNSKFVIRQRHETVPSPRDTRNVRISNKGSEILQNRGMYLSEDKALREEFTTEDAGTYRVSYYRNVSNCEDTQASIPTMATFLENSKTTRLSPTYEMKVSNKDSESRIATMERMSKIDENTNDNYFQIINDSQMRSPTNAHVLKYEKRRIGTERGASEIIHQFQDISQLKTDKQKSKHRFEKNYSDLNPAGLEKRQKVTSEVNRKYAVDGSGYALCHGAIAHTAAIKNHLQDRYDYPKSTLNLDKNMSSHESVIELSDSKVKKDTITNDHEISTSKMSFDSKLGINQYNTGFPESIKHFEGLMLYDNEGTSKDNDNNFDGMQMSGFYANYEASFSVDREHFLNDKPMASGNNHQSTNNQMTGRYAGKEASSRTDKKTLASAKQNYEMSPMKYSEFDVNSEQNSWRSPSAASSMMSYKSSLSRIASEDIGSNRTMDNVDMEKHHRQSNERNETKTSNFYNADSVDFQSNINRKTHESTKKINSFAVSGENISIQANKLESQEFNRAHESREKKALHPRDMKTPEQVIDLSSKISDSSSKSRSKGDFSRASQNTTGSSGEYKEYGSSSNSSYYKKTKISDRFTNMLQLEPCPFDGSFVDSNSNDPYAALYTDNTIKDNGSDLRYIKYQSKHRPKSGLYKSINQKDSVFAEQQVEDMSPIRNSDDFTFSDETFKIDSAQILSEADIGNYLLTQSSANKCQPLTDKTLQILDSAVGSEIENSIDITDIKGAGIFMESAEQSNNFNDGLKLSPEVNDFTNAFSTRQKKSSRTVKSSEEHESPKKVSQPLIFTENNLRKENNASGITMDIISSNQQKPPESKADNDHNLYDKTSSKIANNSKSQIVNLKESMNSSDYGKNNELNLTKQQIKILEKEKCIRSLIERNRFKSKLNEIPSSVAGDCPIKETEMHLSQDVKTKLQSVQDYGNKTNIILDPKDVKKIWTTEMYRNKYKHENEKLNRDKSELGSSTDIGGNQKNVQLSQKENTKRKAVEAVPATSSGNDLKAADDKLKNSSESARQDQISKSLAKAKSDKYFMLKKELPDVNKMAMYRHESKLKEKLKQAKQDSKEIGALWQSDTNELDKFNSSLVDSSLVDNVARAWLENTQKKNNFRDTRKLHSSNANRQSNLVSLVQDQVRRKRDSLRNGQLDPTKKDYIETFPHPTFLFKPIRIESVSPDFSSESATSSKVSRQRQKETKQLNNEASKNFAELSSGKLTTLNRAGKKDINYESSKLAKTETQNLENRVSEPVSTNSKLPLNPLPRNGLAEAVKKKTTKDDTFIKKEHTSIAHPPRSKSGDQQNDMRNNKLDGITPESSQLNKEKKYLTAKSALEERWRLKNARQSLELNNKTKEQKVEDVKGVKSTLDEASVKKSKSENAKSTKTSVKSAKPKKVYDPFSGNIINTDQAKLNKSKDNNADQAKLNKSKDNIHAYKISFDNQKSSKVESSTTVNKPPRDSLIEKGQMLSYKVLSNGSRSEIVKSTTKLSSGNAVSEHVIAEDLKSSAIEQEAAKFIPKSNIPETLPQPIQPVPAPVGLFTRLINALTRTTKMSSAAETTDTVSIINNMLVVNNCTGEHTNQPGKQGGEQPSVKRQGEPRNKQLRNRSPYMSVRNSTNLR